MGVRGETASVPVVFGARAAAALLVDHEQHTKLVELGGGKTMYTLTNDALNQQRDEGMGPAAAAAVEWGIFSALKIREPHYFFLS